MSKYLIEQTFVQWLDYLNQIKKLRLKNSNSRVSYPANHPWVVSGKNKRN